MPDHHNFGGVDIDQPAPLDDEHLPGFVDDLNAILYKYYAACVYDDDSPRRDDGAGAGVDDQHDGPFDIYLGAVYDHDLRCYVFVNDALYDLAADDGPTAGDNQPL